MRLRHCLVAALAAGCGTGPTAAIRATGDQDVAQDAADDAASDTAPDNGPGDDAPPSDAMVTDPVVEDAEPGWLEKPAFHSYFFAPRIIREAHEAGIDTYSVDTNIFGDDTNFTAAVASGPGVWDFSALERDLAMILDVDPEAKIIIRAYAGAPDWWKNLVPSELEAYADGCTYVGSQRDTGGACVTSTGASPSEPAQSRHVSIASKVLMDHWKLGIQQLAAALVASGRDAHVIGITLTGMSSQEWIWWDANFAAQRSVRPLAYGVAHRQAYATWHEQRYGVALDVPSESDFDLFGFDNPGASAFVDLAYSANVVHYFQFRNELVANVIDALAVEMREAFPGRRVGAIYGYMNEMGGDPAYGHNALGRLLASTAIDFINPMSSYQDRAVTGADFERQPLTSVKLSGKLLANDLDQGTHVSKQNYDALCGIYGASSDPRLQEVYRLNCQSGDPSSLYALAMAFLGFRLDPTGTHVIEPTLFDDVSNFRRYLAYSVTRDIRFSYLSLHNDPTAGSERSYLSDATLLSSVVPQLGAAKARSFTHDRASVAEVLVVSDEDSNNFARNWPVQPSFPDRSRDTAGLGYHALATSRIGLNRMGAPYDHVLMADLPRIDINRYKLIVFLNAWSVDANMRALIDGTLKGGGRTILWNYASGLFADGAKAMQNISGLVGIDILNGGHIRAPSVVIDSSVFPLFGQNHTVTPSYAADCCDALYAADPTAAVLGYYAGTSHVSMAAKYYPTWKSIWTATVALPPAVFRDIARSAGVHIYSASDEPFYANASYVALVAGSAGQRTIAFPTPRGVYDAVSDVELTAAITELTFDVVEGGVYFYRLD